MRLLKWIVSVGAALAMAACGGGGGDAGTPPFGDGNGGGGGTDTPAAYSVAVTLSRQTVTSAQPAIVTAVVTDEKGNAQPNKVVTFTTSLGMGAFLSPTALTDADGRATTALAPSSTSAVGADTVVASVTFGDKSYTGSIGFQLTSTDVTISSFESGVGAQALPAYAETQLTVTLAGTVPSSPVRVALLSACASQGRATLTPTGVSTSTGSATFTYRDAGCGAFSKSDTVQATVDGSGATQSLAITLTAPSAASIAFVSASPAQIYLKGSGFDESSIVTFQVRDANGVGVPNKAVTLEPTTLAGGLLVDGGSAAVTKFSDANGRVLVRINSGTVPTPVRVGARLDDDSTISTVSSALSIAVGLPSQRNYSLAQATKNIEGYDVDGTKNSYTVIASDRLGNPVPDGTKINFVTEGGQVQAVTTTTVLNGLSQATVNFQTSSPRPLDGRVTVLSYALGEESFLDENGNNVFDANEDYQDLGDVFLDRLFNGSYNATEDQYISLDVGAKGACHDAVSPLLQLTVAEPSRTLATDGSSLSTCTSGWGRAYVRKAAQTIFSTSTARLGWRVTTDPRAYAANGVSCPSVSLIDAVSTSPYAISDAAARVPFYPLGSGNVALYGVGKAGSFSFLVADQNPVALNPVAANSKISASATAGLSVTVPVTAIPSTLSPTSAGIGYEFDDDHTSGTVYITVTSPSGLGTVFAQYISMDAPPSGAQRCP